MEADSIQGVIRVTRSRATARANYDRLSRWYDLAAGWLERRFTRAGLRMLDVWKDEHVLEIGFGTGAGLVDIAEAVGPYGSVHGVDLSPGMSAVAEKRIREAGLLDRVRLVTGDALISPLPTDYYDAVFMSFVLELFDTPEIPILLERCRAALRAGGRIGVVALSKGDGGRAVQMYERGHRRFPGLLDCRPIYPAMAVELAGFEVAETVVMKMLGLPVEIVVANR